MEAELQNLKKDYTDLLKVVNELKTELKEKSKSRSRSRSRRPSRTRSPSEKGRFPNTDSEDHLTSGKESDGDSDLSDTKPKKQQRKKLRTVLKTLFPYPNLPIALTYMSLCLLMTFDFRNLNRF